MPTRPIKAIFFTRFLPKKGSRVLHQVPEGSITPSTGQCALPSPLFNFSDVSDYIIPKQEFCDRLLTICINHYRVIGYPVCIKGEGKYNRNEFIFNFAMVIDEDLEDWGAYGSVVRKLGKLLRGLEEQDGFLSREEEEGEENDAEEEKDVASGFKGSRLKKEVPREQDEDSGLEDMEGSGVKDDGGVSGRGKVYALCEMILEDLNNYCECMIPIDESNTINLKLFPAHDPPAPIYAWHAPLLTIDLNSFSSSTISSDLTLNRILPYIDGVNSVSRISQMADTDLSLTRKAVQHLVYYGCVILLDIFQYGAIYAPTPQIGDFLFDEAMQEECANYIQIPRMRLGKQTGDTSTTSNTQDARSSISSISMHSETNDTPSQSTHSIDPNTAKADDAKISAETLIMLYTSLRQGLTLRNWCMENFHHLPNIDVRRMITFGIIKGFLYRVHKYAIITGQPGGGVEAKQAASATLGGIEEGMSGLGIGGDSLPLVQFLDGMHCFDEICTELRMSERAVVEKMRGLGDVHFIYK